MSIEQKDPRAQTQAAATQRRYRTLAVVKQEAITRVEKPLEDSVFVWPHLLVREFFAAAMVTVMVTIMSIVINAPLRDPANPNLRRTRPRLRGISWACRNSCTTSHPPRLVLWFLASC